MMIKTFNIKQKTKYKNRFQLTLFLFLLIAPLIGCSLSGKIKSGNQNSGGTSPSGPSSPVTGTDEISFQAPTEYIKTSNQSSYTISGTCKLSSNIVVEVNSTVVKSDVACSSETFSAQLNLSSYPSGTLSLKAYPSSSDVSPVPETTVSIVKDIDAPTFSGSLADGTSFVSVVASPTLSWSAAADPHSGVLKYQLAIGSTSGAADISAWSDIGSVTSYQVTGLTLTRGTTYYASLRAIDNAGNVSSVLSSDGWEADSQVNAISGLTLLEADTSLTASPDVSFSYSQTGNTLSFSEFEYSIGSTSGGTDLQTWTSIASSTTFQATGLSLSVDTTYYVNVRAKDVSGKTSSVVTGQWRVVNTVSVAARYSSAQNWNDYVKKSATTTACQTTDTFYYNCIHGGEKKEVSVTGENSCAGMTAYDTLGVFDWVCQAGTPVKMVSIEVKPGKGLKDLVNATSWKNNRVIIKKSGTPVAASNSAAWWTNTVSALPDSTAGQVTLSNASRIYTLSSSQLSRGYYINANKIAIVTLGDAKLTLDPNGTANATSSGGTGTDYYAMFINGTRLHTWIEGNFAGSFYSSALNAYFVIGNFQYFNVVNNSQIEDFYYGFYNGPARTLFKAVRSSRNRIFHYDGATGLNNSVVKYSSLQSEFDFLNGTGGSNAVILGNYLSSSGTNGLNIYTHTNANLIGNTLNGNVNLISSTRANVHNTLSVSATLSTFSNMSSSALTLSQFLAKKIDPIYAATNLKITGLFGYLTCTAYAFTGTGINSDCSMAGSSNATTVTPIDVMPTSGAQPLVGLVSSDSNHSGYNASTGVAYSSVTNWTKFDRASRFWVDSSKGSCESGDTCYIYDHAIASTDTVILNKSGNLSSANDTFSATATDNCPSQVSGSDTITDQRTSAQTFLRNAIEITGDVIGDDDGLCESSEACIYTPNLGAYQGHGDFTTRTCTFQDGTVTGVTMYAYPQNGY